jgi:protein-L-isoaspartate(D-aspartate) O-methyltransferase
MFRTMIPPEQVTTSAGELDVWRVRREIMVATQLVPRGIRDARALTAMLAVPRHEFVPPELRELAYQDRALPIGAGQTISQPYIVALMTQSAAVGPGSRVLEIGTGSGYQAAVLAEMGAEVFTIEIIESLARFAAATLGRMGYHVQVQVGDGHEGWPEEAPFDAVLVTAAPGEIPRPLQEQVSPDGGRMVIPVGDEVQDLLVVRRQGYRYQEARIAPVRFVPMTGEARQH